jgi:hypothetical protein
MNSTIAAALISALVALTAAITSAIVTRRGWREDQRRKFQQLQYESEIAHVKRQIEELYGPLYGLIQKSEAIGKVYEKVLPSNEEKSNVYNKTDHYKNIWLFFRENYFYPIGEKQAELINSKTHLLYSKEMPESFDQFLRHQATRECLLRLWKEYNIDSMKRGVNSSYPEKQFKDDVKFALDQLKEEYRKLVLLKSDEWARLRVQE